MRGTQSNTNDVDTLEKTIKEFNDFLLAKNIQQKYSCNADILQDQENLLSNEETIDNILTVTKESSEPNEYPELNPINQLLEPLKRKGIDFVNAGNDDISDSEDEYRDPVRDAEDDLKKAIVNIKNSEFTPNEKILILKLSAYLIMFTDVVSQIDDKKETTSVNISGLGIIPPALAEKLFLYIEINFCRRTDKTSPFTIPKINKLREIAKTARKEKEEEEQAPETTSGKIETHETTPTKKEPAEQESPTPAASKERNTYAENHTSLLVSLIAGVLAGVYSQPLQIALFGKIIFGKALLFGYTLPAIALAGAAITFGLTVSVITFAVIFIAKYNQGETLFEGIVKAIASRPSTKTLLPALLLGLCISVIYPYSEPLQMLFFSKVLLGGSVLMNLGLACIGAAIIALIMGAFLYKNLDYSRKVLGAVIFVLCTLFANPIMQSLFGTTLVSAPLAAFIASSITTGMVAVTIYGLLVDRLVSPLIYKKEPNYGFTLTMYAVSFIVLSIYATPIQMAIVGHAMFVITPMLSSISFGVLVSIITSPILKGIYRFTERAITPNLIKAGTEIAESEFGESASYYTKKAAIGFIDLFSPTPDKKGNQGTESKPPV